MENQPKKYIAVAYDLYTDNSKGIHELVEQAPAEHPFQFISGMGAALDSFEEKMLGLNEGDTFDFTLEVDDAYGPYEQAHVLSLDKSIFSPNGHFDKENIFPGNVIPLMNEDGNRFQGLILEVKEDKVVVDLNHPLAGKKLHFKGSVVTSRPATDDEIQGMINLMSGEGCGCCGGEDGCGGCGGEHHCHHEGGEHHCHEEGGEHHCHHEGGKHHCCGGGHCH